MKVYETDIVKYRSGKKTGRDRKSAQDRGRGRQIKTDGRLIRLKPKVGETPRRYTAGDMNSFHDMGREQIRTDD